MKKLLRIGLCVFLVVCVSFILFACNKAAGLTELNTEWKTDTYARGKEAVRSSDMISYPDYSSALTADKTASPYYFSLNGTWDFAFTANHNSVPDTFMKPNYEFPDESQQSLSTSKTEVLKWGTVEVPGNWELSGYGKPSYSKSAYAWETSVKPMTVPEIDNEIGLYRKTIQIPSDWNGREIYISFDGVASGCYVYVNGAFVGYGEDSYTTKTFRITDYVQAGKDALIAVKVYKYTYSSWIEAQDAVKLGGIFKDVYLTSSPKVRVNDISVGVTFDDKFENVSLKIDVDVASVRDSNSGYTLELAVVDQNGQTWISNRRFGKDLKFTANKIDSAYYKSSAGERIPVENPRKWSAEDPFLYTAVVTLKDSEGNVVDVASTNFGMVSSGFYVDDKGSQKFRVNGKDVKINGVMYYEFSAETGLAVSEEELLQDVLAMKALNINAVRSPGIPFSNTFLDLCDKYGLYVVSDINLESQPYANKDEASLPASQSIWQSTLIDRLLNVVDRDANRASVIMWAIGHESGTGSSFKDLRNYLINNLDDRLIIYDDDEAYSDIIVGVDWSFAELNEQIRNAGKKPILLEMSQISYLNSAGNLSTYMDIINSNDCLIGGFFGYWADKALYWPIEEANASNILRETPYAEDPSLYQLAYSGFWGEKISDSTKGLTGIVTADKLLQSESGEYKSVFSPVTVTATDLKNGTFTVTNNNSFINFEDNYVIRYEIYENTAKISEGTVNGISLLPGQSVEVSVPYGELDTDKNEYFVNIYVDQKSEKAWNTVSGGNVAVYQFDITGKDVLPNSKGEDSYKGEGIDVRIVEKPELYATALDLYLGKFYITNNSDVNFKEMFDASYELYEINNFWAIPRSVLIASGDININAPAHTKYAEQKFTYTMPQKAVEGGDYFFVIRMVLKTDINEEYKAGSELKWVFDEKTLGAPIPFETDPERTPHEQLDEQGKPVLDENGTPIIVGGDPEPDASIGNAYVEDPDYSEYTPFTTFSNDTMTVEINNETGLITKYIYNGYSMIYAAGPQFSTYRTPTGGDQLSEVVSAANTRILKASAAGKLAEPVYVKKISGNHYQVKIKYVITDNNYEKLLLKSHETDYIITYDIFGDGEIVVSYTYDPSLYAGIPMQIANVFTFNRDFSTVSWFGRGPSENYPDRVAGSLVGLYENVSVYDMTEDYLYYSGNGDRSDVRWLELANTNGIKLLISSDTSNFAFNVSKVAPGTASAYTRNVLREMSLTYLSVIADNRGVSSGNISDSANYTENSIIEPGKEYTFSYRITPFTEGNADTIARTSLIVDAPEIAPVEIKNGTYAISSITATEVYVSSSEDGLTLISGLGTEDQMWQKLKDPKIFQIDLFQVYNVGQQKYLTPVSTNAKFRRVAEIGLGSYYSGNAWQCFFIDPSYKNLMANTFSLSVQTVDNTLGGRTVLMAMTSDASGCWEFVPVSEGSDTYWLRNKKSGYYLTPVDSLTYRNEILEDLADKYRNYPTTDWNAVSSLKAVRPKADIPNSWIKTTKSVTSWTLLPNDTQRWTLTKVSGDMYSIVNNDTGKALTLDDSMNVVEAENTGADNQVWTVISENGLTSFINKANGYALTQEVDLVPMTQDEINEHRITDMADAFWKINKIVAREWSGAASQKWALQSEDDLKVKIEAGDNWFVNPVAEE